MVGTQALVSDFVSKLRRRKIEGSQATARLTAELLRVLISQHKQLPANGAAALTEFVRSVGEQLIAANPIELAVGNIVRRVLHIIQEEDFSLLKDSVGGLKFSAEAAVEDISEGKNNQNSLAASVVSRCLQPPLLRAVHDCSPDSPAACQISASRDGFQGKGKSADRSAKILKSDVIKAVNELIEDIDTCHEQIAEQAVELIHHNEVVLTLGRSSFVMEFLCAAKEKKRSFHVFIAEGAPRFEGHVLAQELAKKGLKTTVITDSAVFAIICRVNMIVVGVHAVMANGSIIAPVGMNMIALAAKKHAVPFVVVAGTHELCPLYSQNPEVLLNEMRSPFEVLDFKEFSDAMDYGIGSGSPLLHVVDPAFDYVPPELLSLFVTDIGGYSPSYINRLIADYYSSDNLTLQQKPAS
ncbi:Translation initiation factor eIF-2B subunit beta [Melia azedarach]|uniref:Translation initiation factor eIF-2B subunit beta n=1 Tax=Melia azedarach TaxID=155640 RepID=A0ACC1YG45_MELAZ|nr:Translation initiation factor eIF-2B subunit beta [Melia azedarach]